MVEIFVCHKIDISPVIGGYVLTMERFDFNPQTSNLEIKEDWSKGYLSSDGDRLWDSPAFADFNGDAIPEVYVGNVILNSHTGQPINHAYETNTGNPPTFTHSENMHFD